MDSDGSATWEEGYQPELQTDMAIDFIESRSGGEDPFFLFLSFGPPHTPFNAPAEYEAMYDPEELQLRENVSDRLADQARSDLQSYYGMITSLDDQLHRLLETLDGENVADDTIVLFTSDHGEMMGSHDQYYKGSPLEESIHVPLLWRHPESLPAGESVDELTSLIDIMPTVLSMCDLPVPEGVQGIDLEDVLRGEATPKRDGIYIENELGRGESEWRAIRTDEYLYAVDADGNPEHLYNMTVDPFQQNNITDLPHIRNWVQSLLVESARTYDDRRYLARIDERAN